MKAARCALPALALLGGTAPTLAEPVILETLPSVPAAVPAPQVFGRESPKTPRSVSDSPVETPGGGCVYSPLTDGSGATVTVTPSFYTFDHPGYAYWSTLGILSSPGDDWDVALYGASGPYPACVSTWMASSTAYSGVDVVVADFSHDVAATRWIQASRWSGTGPARLAWNTGYPSGDRDLFPNGGPVVSTVAPDVIDCWDVLLEAGVEYGIRLFMDSGSSGAQYSILVFENPAAAPYAAGRSSAALDVTTAGGALEATYTPLRTSTHAILVVNENWASDGYAIEIGTCGPAPALASNISVLLAPGVAHRSTTQTVPYWSVVGMRPETPSQDTWFLERYATFGGAAWPRCQSNPGPNGLRVLDASGWLVQFVATDYNVGGAPLGTSWYSLGPTEPLASDIRIEWDGGADLLSVDGPPVSRTTDLSDVVEVWDVWLQQDVPYNLTVSAPGTVRLFPLVCKPGGGFALPSPGDPGSFCGGFVPSATGWHGVALFNVNRGTGTYEVSVLTALVDVADATLQNPEDSRGAAWGDFDGDGDQDLYVANQSNSSRLFENDGYGNFADVTPAALGLAGLPVLHPAWGDFDNDDDVDLVVTQEYGPVHLLRNDGAGAFSDVTAPPLDGAWAGTEIAWIDVDRDGFLDLWLAGLPDAMLFAGDGSGGFVPSTPAALFGVPIPRGAWGDYDDDGDLDLFAVSPVQSRLLRNDGAWSFTDVSAPPLDAVTGNDAVWSDLLVGPAPGCPDLFVVEEAGSQRLFHNTGGGVFMDVSSILPAGAPGARGTCVTDFNGDGMLDLCIASYGGPNRLLENNGAQFLERTPAPILLSDATTGITWSDVDGDGDQEAYVTTDAGAGTGLNQLIGNQWCPYGDTFDWLAVDLRGVVSNRDGVGARVTCHSRWGSSFRDLTGQAAGYSSAPLLAHFRLPEGPVDSLTVRWPSGIVQTVIAPATHQRITIVELAPVGFDPRPPVQAFSVRVRPNPFRHETEFLCSGPRPGPVAVRIFDVQGRLVRTLRGDLPGAIPWDGRDTRGRIVHAGTYFYKLTSGANIATGKLVQIH